MDAKIPDVVTRHVETSQRVIHREREVDDGPARDRSFRGWDECVPERPELADRLVVDNRRFVVPDEGHVEAVPVRADSGQDDQRDPGSRQMRSP